VKVIFVSSVYAIRHYFLDSLMDMLFA